jgi:hypothetical protein
MMNPVRLLLYAFFETAISRRDPDCFFHGVVQCDQCSCTIHSVLKSAVLLLSLVPLTFAAQPVIENERVAVFDTTTALPPAEHDFVTVSLTHKGTASLGKKGEVPNKAGEHAIVIVLKDHAVPPLANTTGYPLAFPRPHVVKLYETDKVLVWSYHWNPGEPTPMHFHDKDVVVVYEEPTALTSTTPDGKKTVNEYKDGEVRFNLRNRTHTELLVRGGGSAVMTELK